MKTKIKSWTCEICDSPVNELGAYAKISSTRYAHLSCLNAQQFETGRQTGRKELIDEINREKLAQMEQERKTREETQARERAEAERRLEIAERERTNRIIAAQNNPLPPKIEPKKEEANAKQQEERPDRFKLIDLE